MSILLRTYFPNARATKKQFIDTLTTYWFKTDTLRRLWIHSVPSKHTKLMVSGVTGEEYITVVSKNSSTYSPKLWRVNRDDCLKVKTLDDMRIFITTLHAGAPMIKDKSVSRELCQWRSLRKIGKSTDCAYKSTVSKRLKKWVEKFWLQRIHRYQYEKEIGNFQIENWYFLRICDFLFNRYNALFTDQRTWNVQKSTIKGQRTHTIEFDGVKSVRTQDYFKWVDMFEIYGSLRAKF